MSSQSLLRVALFLLASYTIFPHSTTIGGRQEYFNYRMHLAVNKTATSQVMQNALNIAQKLCPQVD